MDAKRYDINDMMVFATVVETGSFTAAAESMGLPKSNISRKVSRLESELGVRLLERSTRSQHLTEVGERYYAYCQRIKEELEASRLAVETLLEKPQGRLKVCASVAIGQGMLAPLLAHYYQQYPDVQVDLDLTNRRVDVLEEGYDVVIRVGELPSSNLIAKKLCQLKLALYCAPSYVEQAGLPVQPGDLTQHQCLLMSAKERKPVWQLFSPLDTTSLVSNQSSPSVSVAFAPVLECDDFSVLKQLALDGMGITELPQYLANGSVECGDLVEVLPEWQFSPVDLYAIYPSHRGATPKVRSFLDFVHDKLSPFRGEIGSSR
ncbi:LysR family transcriptional regulator [Vibrio sp. SCSIO 43135]|uniref:LysR family transcriptional regulator n=1 Tax=Vibrio sp. SCSIO 43135 TaxID=2819096 RepID=UPI0020766300|nr:LysR family transcriptional regulator [Vibrio sp. SCSIO 43135]